MVNAPEETAYRRLARELQTAILQNRYAHGERLPTEFELSAQYSLSRQTVRRAFQELVSYGLVERIPGRGTFVASTDKRFLVQHGTLDNLMTLPDGVVMKVITPLRIVSDPLAATRLALSDDMVGSTALQRLLDGKPIGVTFVAIRPDHLPPSDSMSDFLEPDRITTTALLTIIDEMHGHPIAEVEQQITAVAADSQLAKLLPCPVGSPLLCIERLHITTKGTAVELATSYFLPQRYSYQVRLHRTLHEVSQPKSGYDNYGDETATAEAAT